MKDYLKVFYGRPSGSLVLKLQNKVLAVQEQINARLADLIARTYEKYAKDIGDLACNEEDILSYAFLQKLEIISKKRKKKLKKVVFAF